MTFADEVVVEPELCVMSAWEFGGSRFDILFVESELGGVRAWEFGGSRLDNVFGATNEQTPRDMGENTAKLGSHSLGGANGLLTFSLLLVPKDF